MLSSAACLLALATTATAQIASVTIEASHGGAGNGLTNTTISVPVGTTHTDPALDTVSYLFLTGASGVSLESITCTPYRFANGTGAAGAPFTSTQPSLLSTNTVQVGSLVCISSTANGTTTASIVPYPTTTTSLNTTTTSQAAPTTAKNSTAVTTASVAPSTTLVSTTASLSSVTSTLMTTVSAAGSSTAQASTVTSVAVVDSSPTATLSTVAGAASASSTDTAAATLSSGNAAAGRGLGAQGAWSALAIVGMGLAFAV